MSRMVARPRIREGRGIGERISESFVFLLLAAAVVGAGYWYFAVYRKSPQVALQSFIGAMNAGNPNDQYALLASSSQRAFGSKEAYRKFPLAYGFSARIANYTFGSLTTQDGTAKATVNMTVRRETGKAGDPGALLEVASDTFTDQYALTREGGAWKVVLEKSSLQSLAAASGSER